MKEEAVQFGKAGSLVGIVTSAESRGGDKPAVLLLNPGIVHRVGPGRIYVKIARALAEQGFTVLRFDFSGIGDSSVRLDNRRFEESSVDETCAAMTFLQATRDINRFILLGGCSGAAVSLETARVDGRAIGGILINFPSRVRDDESTSARKDHHYYWNFAFWSMTSWRKLLTGQSDYRKIGRTLAQRLKRSLIDRMDGSNGDARFQAMLRELAERGFQMTFICSKGDVLLADLREAGGRYLKRLCMQGRSTCDVIPRSDHTFSSLYDQERLIDVVIKRANAAALISVPQALTPAVASTAVEALFEQRQIVP